MGEQAMETGRQADVTDACRVVESTVHGHP